MLKHLKVHIFLGKAFELIYVIYEHFSAMKKIIKNASSKTKINTYQGSLYLQIYQSHFPNRRHFLHITQSSLPNFMLCIEEQASVFTILLNTVIHFKRRF